MPRSIALPLAAACLGIATYAIMDALMKRLGLGIGAYGALVWRMAAGSVLTGVLWWWHRPAWPRRAVIRVHARRSVVVTAMALCFFWGITRMPLAEAVALTFIAPLIALALAALVLGERAGRGALIGSLLGLGGVGVVLAGRLGEAHGPDAGWGAAAVLTSAVLYAINLVMARHQAQLARPIEIALFQNLFILALLIPAAPWLGAMPRSGDWPLIVAAAALAVVSLLLLSWSYARAAAPVLLPVEYTAFIWAAVMGRLVFGERLSLATVAGTVLIVGGCLLAARQRGGPAQREAEAMA